MLFHDWRTTVVRWLFMPFSQDFLVIPIKKTDTSVKYKRLLNLTQHESMIPKTDKKSSKESSALDRKN